MPLIIRGHVYPLPKEAGRTGPTGTEIDIIESHFGVDYQDLMATIAPADPKKKGEPAPFKSGCTRNRALWSLAWLCIHREDASATISSVMDSYGMEELEFSSEGENPTAAVDPIPAA